MSTDGFQFHVNGPPEFVAVVLITVVLPLYFLPTIIAVARRCRSDVVVGIINLLLGWTVIGWVVALGIAVGSRRRSDEPATVVMSADGAYWWDGSAWQDAVTTFPPHAPRSPDGYHWWDGTRWRPIPPPPGGTWAAPPPH
jgi:TM2 domain-containing membrane protein YozV